MDIERAKEIVVSPVMVNVTFQGEQVYIKEVNEEDKTALIYPLDSPQELKTVEVARLIEH